MYIMTKVIFSKDHKYTVEQLKKARLEAGQRRLDITQLKEFAKIYKKDLSFFIK